MDLVKTDGSAEDRFLTPDEIFAAEDIGYEDVEMPEWPKKDGHAGIIRLRMLSALDMQQYVDAIDGAAKRNAMILMIMKSAVKPADNATPLFTRDQLQKLQQKSVKAFSRLQDEILRINGLDKAAERARKNA
jgi:hypothetical protein